jgi:hypothetical protein
MLLVRDDGCAEPHHEYRAPSDADQIFRDAAKIGCHRRVHAAPDGT